MVAEKRRRTQDTDHGSADALFSFSIINSGCLCPRGNGDAILVIPGYAELVLIIPWNRFQVVAILRKTQREEELLRVADGSSGVDKKKEEAAKSQL